MTSPNPDYKDYLQLKMDRNRFGQSIGFVLTEIGEGYVNAEMPITALHEQQNGFVHGGIIGSVCDMVCGFAAYSMVPAGVQVFTVEIKTVFLRPAVGEKLVARGKVIRAGKTFHFCEGEVYSVNNGEEKLVAKATSTMSVTDRKMNDKYGG